MAKINREMISRLLQESFHHISNISAKVEKLREAWEREDRFALYSSLKEYVEFKANCGSIFGYGDFFVWLFDDEDFKDARPWTIKEDYNKEYTRFLSLL